MSWIRAFFELNQSLFLKGLLLLMAFLLGLQMGQSRLQRRWDAEKQTVQIAQAKQVQHVVDVAQVQNQISKEISDDYRKKSSLLASLVAVPERVLDKPEVRPERVSIISSGSERVDGDTTNGVSTAFRDEKTALSCPQLEQDARRTTLMLLELQHWYERILRSGTQ